MIEPPPTAPLLPADADVAAPPRDMFPPIQPPREFVAEPPGAPLVRPASGYTETEIAKVKEPAKQQAAVDGKQGALESSTAAPADPPWMPLVLTMFLLFASIGGNVYLGWIARNFYLRCRALTREARATTAPAT